MEPYWPVIIAIHTNDWCFTSSWNSELSTTPPAPRWTCTPTRTTLWRWMSMLQLLWCWRTCPLATTRPPRGKPSTRSSSPRSPAGWCCRCAIRFTGPCWCAMLKASACTTWTLVLGSHSAHYSCINITQNTMPLVSVIIAPWNRSTLVARGQVRQHHSNCNMLIQRHNVVLVGVHVHRSAGGVVDNVSIDPPTIDVVDSIWGVRLWLGRVLHKSKEVGKWQSTFAAVHSSYFTSPTGVRFPGQIPKTVWRVRMNSLAKKGAQPPVANMVI